MNWKHLFSLLLALSLSAGMHAQIIERGNFMLGGRLGFSHSTSDVDIKSSSQNISRQGSRNTQLNISPAIGYFLARHFVLGIGMDYTLNRSRQPVQSPETGTEYEREHDSDLLFGPFMRGYLPIGEDKALFLETTFGFGSSINEIDLNGQDQVASTNVLAVGVGPGFTIFSSDAIGIETVVKYNWARSFTDIDFQGTQTKTKSYTNQIDFSVGLQFYFARVQPASYPRDYPGPGDSPSFY